MGATRTEMNDQIYEQRHEYYLKNKDRISKRNKEKYQREIQIRRNVARALRSAITAAKAADGDKEAQAEIQAARILIGTYTNKAVPEIESPKFSQNPASVFLREYKQTHNICIGCQQAFPPYVLDFDHVRGQKIRSISDMVGKNRSIKAIQKEIDKCDVVCANCHRQRTFERLYGCVIPTKSNDKR